MPRDISPQYGTSLRLADELDWLWGMLSDDPGWLKTHPAQVYTAIQEGLKSEEHFARTINIILAILAVIMTDDETKSWFEPIPGLVEQILTGKGETFRTAFHEALRELATFVGVFGAIEKASTDDLYGLIQAYVKLFKALMLKNGLPVQVKLIDQAVIISKKLGDHIEAARLNQTLAHYYAQLGLEQLAEPYARLAFNESEYIDDVDGMIDAACTMSVIYRGSSRPKQAEYFIKRALEKAPLAKIDKRLATLYYEFGAVSYRKNDFETALKSYERALSIFEAYSAEYQVAMSHHAMAQAHIYLLNFDQAEALLLQARSVWERLGVHYEFVNTFFVEADLELKRGNHALGMQALDLTIEIAGALLEDEQVREPLITRVQEYKANNTLAYR